MARHQGRSSWAQRRGVPRFLLGGWTEVGEQRSLPSLISLTMWSARMQRMKPASLTYIIALSCAGAVAEEFADVFAGFCRRMHQRQRLCRSRTRRCRGEGFGHLDIGCVVGIGQ